MADTPMTDAVKALGAISDVDELAEAFGILLDVPGMEEQFDDIDWSSMPAAQRAKAKNGMRTAIDTLKDQAEAQAEAVRSYIDSLRSSGALSGDSTVGID
tara:strand:- start:1512 stop:1811 length:300 start_codon:yes stop_codon:yes gene_type:complete